MPPSKPSSLRACTRIPCLDPRDVIASRPAPIVRRDAVAVRGLGPLARLVGQIVRIAWVAVLLAGSAVSQDFISLPLDEGGNPVLPPGAVLEAAYVIDTFAGTGEEGYAGDGELATQASFRGLYDVELDSEGNVYVADPKNGRVRRVDSSGAISTIAGTGVRRPTGPSGDGGPAVNARLVGPGAIALDADGSIYIAESRAHRVRKIDATGRITTIAGTGEEGYGGDGGPATVAQLNGPNSLEVDGKGNLYVAEYGGRRIRKIDRSGIITTIAGNGIQGFGGDGGPATQAQLDFVGDLAVDAAGNLYFTDLNTARVRKVDYSGTITTVVGTGVQGWAGDGGPATEAEITTPSGIALDAEGNLFLTEYWAGRMRKVDSEGIITTIAGTGEQRSSGDKGLAVDAALDRPSAIAVDPTGKLYVTEAYGYRVRVLEPTDQQARFSLVLGSSGEQVSLTVAGSGTVKLYGQPLVNGFEVTTRKGKTYAISQSASGSIFAIYRPVRQSVPLVDGGSVSLWNGEDDVWRIGLEQVRNGYRHVEDGMEYLLEWTGARWRLAQYTIRTVSGSVDVADGVAAISSMLFNPSGLAMGSKRNLYVADSSNHRVRKIDPSGVITTVAGTGERGLAGDGGPATEAELNSPKGIALNAVGEIFVVDSGNDRVRRIDHSGVITTIPIQMGIIVRQGKPWQGGCE